jgi:hypothetical protein
MSDTPRVVLHPNVGSSSVQARDARARAWAYVFRCHESKKNPAAGPSVRGETDGKAKSDSADVPIIRD